MSTENKTMQKEVKKKSKPQLLIEFGNAMKLLTGELVRRFPNDSTARTVQRKTSVGVSHAPERIFRAVGKYLFKYDEQIRSANYDFFLNNSFSSDFSKTSELDQKELLCLYTINLVKKHWNALQDNEKKQYQQTVVNLLECYIEYRLLEEFDTDKSIEKKS